MTIEIFAFPPSPRAFKVLAVADHLGLDWKLNLLDMMKGAHQSADYARLNPNMKMPTLRDGDFVLWESNAILQYLASKRADAGLMPPAGPAYFDVLRWQFWDAGHWEPPLATLIGENVINVVFRGLKSDAARVAAATETFHKTAKILDAQLTGKTYVTGETLSVADFSLAAPLNMAPRPRCRLPATPRSAAGSRPCARFRRGKGHWPCSKPINARPERRTTAPCTHRCPNRQSYCIG